MSQPRCSRRLFPIPLRLIYKSQMAWLRTWLNIDYFIVVLNQVKSFSSNFFLQTINNIGKNVILGKVSVRLATDHVPQELITMPIRKSSRNNIILECSCLKSPLFVCLSQFCWINIYKVRVTCSIDASKITKEVFIAKRVFNESIYHFFSVFFLSLPFLFVSSNDSDRTPLCYRWYVCKI
jgi:hypothetical protein